MTQNGLKPILNMFLKSVTQPTPQQLEDQTRDNDVAAAISSVRLQSFIEILKPGY